jgi:hypothetical protein
MPFNVNNLPNEKPSSFADIVLEDGMHNVAIESCEYKESTKGNNMLRIVFKTIAEGKFVFDQIMDDPTQQINGFRLGRLLKALGISNISGNLDLKDLPKIITKGKKLRIAIIKKGQYTNIDIDKYDGYYPMEATDKAPVKEPEAQKAGPDLGTPAEDNEFF